MGHVRTSQQFLPGTGAGTGAGPGELKRTERYVIGDRVRTGFEDGAKSRRTRDGVPSPHGSFCSQTIVAHPRDQAHTPGTRQASHGRSFAKEENKKGTKRAQV